MKFVKNCKHVKILRFIILRENSKRKFQHRGHWFRHRGAVSDTDGAGSDSNNGAVPDTDCDGPKP